jgi:flagellar protein FliO/FliZ
MFLSVFVFIGTSLAVESIDSLNKQIDKPEPTDVKAPSLIWNLVKLILVLGVIVAAAWAIIRLFGKQVHARVQGSWLHVVDEVALGTNRGIVLCEIGGRLYALGVTDGQISVLSKLINPQLLETVKQQDYLAASESSQPVKDLVVDRLAAVFSPKSGFPGGKGYFAKMQEQNRRLKGISLLHSQNRGAGEKGNGEDT